MTKVNFQTNGMDVLVYFMWVITSWLIFGIEGLGTFSFFFSELIVFCSYNHQWVLRIPFYINIQYKTAGVYLGPFQEIVENCVLIASQIYLMICLKMTFKLATQTEICKTKRKNTWPPKDTLIWNLCAEDQR